MKIRILIRFFALLLICEAQAKSTTYSDTEKIVTSIEQADALVRETQEQFWQLTSPGMVYIHSERNVRPVVWSDDWPNALKKKMYAEMQIVNGSLYPVYTLWAEADPVYGDLTYYNRYGKPIWTSSAPAGYSPYSFMLERLAVTSVDELTDAQKQMSASNVGLEIQLIPSLFLESYEQDLVMESYSAAMAMSAPPPPGGGGGTNGVPSGGSSANLAESIVHMYADTNGFMVVEHKVGEDWERYAVIYGREHLQ